MSRSRSRSRVAFRLESLEPRLVLSEIGPGVIDLTGEPASPTPTLPAPIVEPPPPPSGSFPAPAPGLA